MVAVRPERDNTTLLEGNRQQLLRHYRQQLRSYETRYELPSTRVVEELQAGRLRETADVCDWVMVIQAQQMLGHESAT